MRPMISVVASALAVSPVGAAGTTSRERNGSPTRSPTAPARARQKLAAGPEPVRAGDPDRQDRGAGAESEEGQPVLGLLEPARRAARALGKDDQDVALVEDPLGEPERLDVGGAAVDRMDRAVGGRIAPMTGHSSISACRASGCAGRARGEPATR